MEDRLAAVEAPAVLPVVEAVEVRIRQPQAWELALFGLQADRSFDRTDR